MSRERLAMHLYYVKARIKCFLCRKRNRIVHNTSQGSIPCKQFLKDYGYCVIKEVRI